MNERIILWNALCQALLRWIGLELPDVMHGLALAVVMRQAEKANMEPLVFLASADADGERQQALIEGIGLGTTWFMRDEAGLRTLTQALVSETSRDKILWLWSAGCSSGEETYTLAMSLAERGVRARVLGTDINRTALARAQEGLYSARAIERVPKSWLWRYFDREGENYRVKSEIRQSVSFEQHNLVSGEYPPDGWFRFDALVCRNVLIYFDQERSLSIIRSMATACRPRGYMLLGAIERPIFWMSNLVEREDATELVQVFHDERGAGDVRFKVVTQLNRHIPRPRGLPRGAPDALDNVDRESVANLLDRADTSLHAGDPDTALMLIDAALVKDPLNAPGHLARGLVLKQANRVHEAIESLRAARFLDGSTWLAPYQLALCLESAGLVEDAREAFLHALGVLDDTGMSGLHRPSADVDMLGHTAAEVCRRRIAETDP